MKIYHLQHVKRCFISKFTHIHKNEIVYDSISTGHCSEVYLGYMGKWIVIPAEKNIYETHVGIQPLLEKKHLVLF